MSAGTMTPDPAVELLVDPSTGMALERDGSGYRTGSGQAYQVEDGIVRMLGAVDPDLAREIQAQHLGVEEYSLKYLMPRYEPDMARLALVDFFGGRPPKGAVLDAGCGIGLLGRLFPDLGLVGLDASMTLLGRATMGYRLRVEASAEALPFRDETFDVVVALNMLHHVIHPETAVKEFARVLKPGGTLVAVDPRKLTPIELAKQALRGKSEVFAPTHKAFTVDEYDALVEHAGLFQIEQRKRVGLLTLLAMGGLDALRVSPRLPYKDLVASTLRGVDRALFRIPGVEQAGLNLAVRARRRQNGGA